MSLAIDVASQDQWVAGVPHEAFATLRREAPVYRHPGVEVGHPEFFWALTRHDDVRAANRDVETFSSEIGGVQMWNPDPETHGLFKNMIDTDPPDHTRLRRLVNRGFTPRIVATFEEHYHEVTRQLIDRAVAKGSFDFVTEVAAELPLIAIAELLGIPEDERQLIFEWTNKMVGSSDPEYVLDENEPLEAGTQLYQYANQLGAKRLADPRDDIVTKLITEVDGDALGAHEFEVFILLLSVAGNETTRNAITHGLLGLLENPDQMTRLRDGGRELFDTAVEEMIRWASPVIHFRRTATRDVEIRDTRISAGDPVVLFYISANRDEEAFVDPFRFAVDREPNDHLGFGGGGPHFCLGANLARIEMRVMFEELLARTSSIEQTGPPERLRSNFINGIKHLPVTVTPA